MAEKYKRLSYKKRLELYETRKKEIFNSCFDHKEYEIRVKKLACELGI